MTTTLVRIACAHLDQDTANNDGSNLSALCQRCHLEHDRAWNMEKRRLTVLLRRALGGSLQRAYRR